MIPRVTLVFNLQSKCPKILLYSTGSCVGELEHIPGGTPFISVFLARWADRSPTDFSVGTLPRTISRQRHLNVPRAVTEGCVSRRCRTRPLRFYSPRYTDNPLRCQPNKCMRCRPVRESVWYHRLGVNDPSLSIILSTDNKRAPPPLPIGCCTVSPTRLPHTSFDPTAEPLRDEILVAYLVLEQLWSIQWQFK